MSTLPNALKTLAEYRIHNTRASQEVLDKGSEILKSGKANAKLGDEGASRYYPSLATYSQDGTVWPFLEQLFLAAIDVGRLDVADVRFLILPVPTVKLTRNTSPGMLTFIIRQVSWFTTRRRSCRNSNRGFRIS
jgi:hypothetical protein